MRKTLFFLLLFTSCILSAQVTETVEASNQKASQNNKKQDQATRQKEIKEKWLQGRGRKQSQNKKIKKQADARYDRLGYMASTDKYKLLDANEASDRDVMVRMANSYRMNGHTQEAEYWYSKVAKDTDNPEDLLHYAQTLQSNGKCEDAIRWYEKYEEKMGKNRGDSYRFIKDCDELKTFENHENVLVKNMESLNTKHLDFCGAPYKGGMVFTSTRSSNKPVTNTDTWSNDNFTDLYFAEMDGNEKVIDVKLLEGEINGKHHDGVATFNQSESVMIFSRNSKEGKSKKGLIDLKIYMAYNFDLYWSDVKALSFNSEDFATSHPTLSSDGNRLYFSSDRPGGFGGMDIYVSVFDGENWSEPANLGATVNSAGNELFPTIAKDNTLYFSSNGHMGMGGLDLFSVTKSDVSDEDSWDNRKNMGLPFNSEKDDFGFYVNRSKDSGYFSSNRDGGKGGDDIYHWSGLLNENNGISKKLICVYDEKTNEKIKGATVVVYEKDNSNNEHSNLMDDVKNLSDEKQAEILEHMNSGSEEQTFTTNEKGQFLFPAKRGLTYSMHIEKAYYKSRTLDVETKDLLDVSDYCVDLAPKIGQNLTIFVIDKEKDEPLPESKVTISNSCTGKQQQTTTRRDGTVRLAMDCGCEYTIVATKDLFNTDKKVITAQPGDCAKAPDKEKVLLLALLEPTATKDSDEIRALKEYFLGDPNGQFYVGQVIIVEGIYYDYNKWNIRSDAAPKLDKVQQLLKAYPNMEIELMSHTDSRGKAAYNLSLSQNRARSAMKYLLDHEIAKERLSSAGLGERQLMNRCSDGVNCSEPEHQLNRRTEIKINKL